MKVNTISSHELFNSPIWSLQYFLSQQQEDIISTYPTRALGELVFERRETTMPQHTPHKLFYYIGLENIESNTRTAINILPKEGSQIKSSSKIFKAGDILYGRLRPALNKAFLVPDEIAEGVCSTEIFVLIPDKSKVNDEYLSEILISDIVNEKAIALIRGASLPRIQIDDFLQIKIPVPPIEEQELIATFIKKNRTKWLEYRIRVQEIPDYIKKAVLSKVLDNTPFSDYKK